MAYNSSGQYSYPHSHTFQTSPSSLFPPPLNLDAVAASQDFPGITSLPPLDVSMLSADFALSPYSNHGSMPDHYLYYWPFWDPWNPWGPLEANYWFPDSQEYASTYTLPHQTAWETAPFASSQDALQHQSTLPYFPESTSFGAEIIDLSFLPPDERYIVELRLKNEKWKLIQVEYAKNWKPMTISGLAMKLGRIRKRNKVLEYIIPAKPHKRSRTSSTSNAIGSNR